MSQQRPNARRTAKRPTVARGEQKQVSGQSEQSSLPSIRPSSNDDRAAWLAYWQEQNQPWRTEPESSPARRAELEKRRVLVPDVEKGIYPFKGMKLDRADVEWLLATHDGGPIKWSDEKERERAGLDVRGADLQEADLRRLPLTRLRGGLTLDEWLKATEEQRSSAVVLMRGADLRGAQLEGAILIRAQLKGADLSHAQLKVASLDEAQLEGANLIRAQLEGADLNYAQLEGANLSHAQLKGAWLREAQLEGANLSRVILSNQQGVGPQLADVQWSNTNLTVVNWSQMTMLGEEYKAKQQTRDGEKKAKYLRVNEYQTAVRANRQLAVVLEDQGLNEDAARFAYAAQVLQKHVLWLQMTQLRVKLSQRVQMLGAWLFSWFLFLLAGYGYRMWRLLAAYLLAVSACAIAYFVLGIYYSPHLSLLQAFLESITAFHGRVFSELFLPTTPQIWVTAFESIVGLVIEGVFIAMLTRRFFGK